MRQQIAMVWAVLSVSMSTFARGSEPSEVSPLPLAVGNRWVMGVSADGVAVAFAEVTGTVRIRDAMRDTAYSSFADAVGNSGEQYFVLRIAGYMRLFPVDPGTVVVRMDENGSIWCRAVVDREDGMTKVAATDQPWLMVDGPSSWHMRFDDFFYSIEFSRCHGPSLTDFATRYVDEVHSTGGRHRLVRICGQMDGQVYISEGGSSSNVVLLTGIGPIWIPLPTTETELLGLHRELRQAQVGNQTIVPRATVVAPQLWGEVKRKR